ncbi:hypothetical protein BASA83_005692 [Batrachochytrium salamandrivorans]|nr:hypothetical protein BASA83_005692 [Batrachochytrium salamandrivorans]
MTPTTPTRNFFQNNPELGGQLNSLTPKSRIHQDLHSNSVAAGLVTVCPPSPSSPSKFTTLRNRIPADSKAGLSYLMKNNNSIGGVMRHQSISFAFSYFLDAHTTMPCQPPRLRTIRYYDKVSVGFQDCSIGKYVEMLCHDAIMPCSDPSCSHTMACFADEEYHFLESSISSTDLNLLRRMLSERMRERIVSIETLHKDYSSLSSCECDWKLPSILTSEFLFLFCRNLLHLVSSSPTIIREDEPSSVIAFTLSSKPFVEYLGAITAFDSAAGQTFPDFQHTPTPDLDVDSWKSLGGECKYKIKRVSNSLASDAKGKHIHYRVSDSRVVFSCIVYFAKEFHALRKMCGIVPQFIQSLERSVHWNATGGKSTAAFYKTTDDQFILKELSSKWLVDEKETLFKFTPQYFEYLASSDKKPTLLTKILGFYTIKKKNSVTGQSSVLDVLVMENLFANVTISRRFDLKGVPDRHVVPRRIKRQDTKVDSDQVMWDGDWNAGQYKSLLRLFAHSKRILIESVHNDTDFLCKAKVMDYSLLVGVKDDTKELVVGIVDFIAPFNWSKMLEMQGKATIQSTIGSGKAVTVMPPDQYRDRFREAMEHNFLMVPDKWLDVALPDDGLVLPCVL